MRGFNQATILSPSFQGLHKERLAQWPAFCDPKNGPKIPEGYFQKNWVGCAARFLKPLPYFRPKSVIFPALFQTWSKIWYPISDLKPWSPARDRSAWQAVTACTRNTAAKRLRMRQVEHFRSLFQSHFPVRLKSPARSASFCVQLVVQLFCFMLLVFCSYWNCFYE